MNNNFLLLLQIATLGLLLFLTYAHAASIDDEAKKSLMIYHAKNKIVTRCKGRFYRSFIKGKKLHIIEIQDVHPYVKDEDLTYDDRLNGVEWRGVGGINERAYRFYTPKSGWAEWVKPHESNDFIIVKKWGKWLIEPADGTEDFIHNLRPVNCRKVDAIQR